MTQRVNYFFEPMDLEKKKSFEPYTFNLGMIYPMNLVPYLNIWSIGRIISINELCYLRKICTLEASFVVEGCPVLDCEAFWLSLHKALLANLKGYWTTKRYSPRISTPLRSKFWSIFRPRP